MRHWLFYNKLVEKFHHFHLYILEIGSAVLLPLVNKGSLPDYLRLSLFYFLD